MATKLFISYRRDNAGIYARLLHQLLKEKKYKVFLDTEGLEQGLFDEQLLRQIKRCDYFILLLTEGALNRPFVQREVKHALDHNKKVIPIVDKQFRYPNVLPDPLKRLPNYQSIETNIADITQVNYVVQQLQEVYLPKSRSWSKYLLIGLIPLAIFVVVEVVGKDSLSNGFVTFPPVEVIPEPENEQGVTKDKGSEFGDPLPPYGNDGSQDNPPPGKTTKESKPEVNPPPQPPQPAQEPLNGSNTTFKANGRIINGSNDEIIGNGNKINGSNNEITGDSNEIHGSNNEIHGNYNRIYGSNNTCYGHGNEFISGSNNEEI